MEGPVVKLPRELCKWTHVRRKGEKDHGTKGKAMIRGRFVRMQNPSGLKEEYKPATYFQGEIAPTLDRGRSVNQNSYTSHCTSN